MNKKIQVIVIPEKGGFKDITLNKLEAYVNINRGVPKTEERNVKYVAPLWLDANPQGCNRIFHIEKIYTKEDCTVFELGNSFVLDKVWNEMGQHRGFEYHDLDSFNMVEIKDGVLMKYALND